MNTEYLNNFEEKLQQELLHLCTNYGMLDSTLLAADDIDNRWHDLAPEYVADAVGQIRDYPVVSVAWAAYLGLGVAFGWDEDWEYYAQVSYQSYYGEQGFDDMDEHIVRDLLQLPLDSKEAGQLEDIIRRCGQATVSMIRHEQIEPQSPIIRKSKFPQNPKRSVRFSGKRTKRSVQKRKARNTQKAETKVL